MYAVLVAAAAPETAAQAALDRLDAHVADITARPPATRAEAARLVVVLTGELERNFPEIDMAGPIGAGLLGLAEYLGR